MTEGLPPLPTLGPVVRRVPPAGARREWQTAEVVEVREETARARTLRLRLPAGAERHVPGQHYVVRVPRDDGSWAQRSYSVASAPELPGSAASPVWTSPSLVIARTCHRYFPGVASQR